MTSSSRSASLRWFATFVLAVGVTLVSSDLVFAEDAAAPGGQTKGTGGFIGFIVHFFQSLDVVGTAIMGILSISLVAFLVLLMLDLRTGACIPSGFIEEFTDTVNKRQFKQAFDLARGDNSFLARVLTAGMSRLQYGLEDAREASANMLDTIKSGKDQTNSYLAVIGTLGPLLGLVGTVFGMIKAFMGMKETIQIQVLADGISHALCMTLAGVGLAIPAIFFNSFFRNRIMKVSMDCGNIADDLLTQMYHNSKKPAPPSGATPTGTVTAAPAGNGPSDTRGITPVKPA